MRGRVRLPGFALQITPMTVHGPATSRSDESPGPSSSTTEAAQEPRSAEARSRTCRGEAASVNDSSEVHMEQQRTQSRIGRGITAMLCSIAIAAGALSPLQAEAASDTRFALTCLGTKTNETIRFQYRWGSDDSWTSDSVGPGQWKMYSYRYAYEGENRSPVLQIRYDDDFSSDTHYVTTKLNSYAARNRYCEAEGYRYNFRLRGLELYVASEN